MWEFPRRRLDGAGAFAAAVRDLLERDFGVCPSGVHYRGSLRYRVTVHDTRLHVLSAWLPHEPGCASRSWRLVLPGELDSLPLPSPMRRIARSLSPGCADALDPGALKEPCER